MVIHKSYCFTGFPQPTISWYKNGQDLVPKEDSVIISWELNHAKLELLNVNVKDAGRYTCKAVNNVGTASSTADIVVKSEFSHILLMKSIYFKLTNFFITLR